MWLYAIFCPLKFRPLVCHVSASNASTGAPSTGAPKFGALHVKVSTRVFLRASAISMFLVGGMCYVANKWVLGDEAIASLGFREHLHTTPGVVIVAVGTQVCQASRPGSGHRRLEAPSHLRAVLLGLEQSMGRLCPAVHAWSLSAEWGRFHCVRASRLDCLRCSLRPARARGLLLRVDAQLQLNLRRRHRNRRRGHVLRRVAHARGHNPWGRHGVPVVHGGWLERTL